MNTGLSGKNREGLATPGLCDAVVTIICTPEQAGQMTADIEDFLRRYGGIGIVTEAQGLNVL